MNDSSHNANLGGHSPPYLLGYNTNGLANHALLDAIDVLGEIGYRSVAVTIDHGTLSPRMMPDQLIAQIKTARRRLDRWQMRSVVETGARFLLDPRLKHEPTLVSELLEGRERRAAFLRHALDVAAELESDCVSLWSGAARDAADDETVWSRLLAGLENVLDHAEDRGVAIGFEPEPGMFIDRMTRYDELLQKLDSPRLKLTLDVGHLHCQGETPIAEFIERYADRLVNVHLEDMRRGVHEHLMFGEGEIDFGPILQALRNIDYRGGVHVELSRHSHEGPEAARKAFEFLTTT